MPVSIDFETFLISKEQPVPPPVCLSICWGLDEEQDLIHAKDPACKRVLRDLLEGAASGSLKISGYYVAFDMSVACKWFDLTDQVFAAYGAEGIHCSQERQMLIDIARGMLKGYRNGADDTWVKHEYNLDSVASRYGVPKLDKDTYRLRYHEVYDLPIDSWEDGFKVYALDDTYAEQVVHLWQNEYVDFLEDEFRQAETSFGLALISAGGIRTDKDMVRVYERYVQQRIDNSKQLLIDNGFLVWLEKKGKFKREQKKMQEYALQVWAAKGVDFPATETGKVCLDEEACNKSGDPILQAYQIFGSASTQMDRVRELEEGMGEYRIHTRYTNLKKSGRTSSSKPNVQNRASETIGDRESFIPEDGEVLIDMDFDGLELRTISQGCIHAVGFSRLAEVLNAGEDPHLMVAAKLVGCTYEDAKARYKQKDPDIIDARGAGKAKMVNFSCWAGTTVNGLRRHAAEVGYNYTKEEAQEIYNAFLDSWPEAPEYFKWVKTVCGEAGIGTMQCFQSGRIAGLLSYTEACSIISQGLGADATKEALRALVRECWYDRESPLYGCRVYNFIHDQYQIAIPDDEWAHDRAEYAGQVARSAANKWLPDVPTRAKPMLVRRWSKMAEAVRGKDGKLIPWDIHMLGPVDAKGRPWPKQIQEMQRIAAEQEAARSKRLVPKR